MANKNPWLASSRARGGGWALRHTLHHAEASEGAAAVEEDEDHSRPGDCDQEQSSEVGDQMEVDSHGRTAQQLHKSDPSLRSAVAEPKGARAAL